MKPDTKRAVVSGGALSLLSLFGSYLYGTLHGLQGMALGLGGAAFGITALILVIQLIGAAATKGRASRFGAAVSILAFLAKLPLYFVLWKLAQHIGGAAPGCFLTGVCLVYFAVVAWAATR